MGSNLPPGVTPSDIDRAFGGPEPCPRCEGSVQRHEQGCAYEGMDPYEIEEAEEQLHARSWDDVKEDPTPRENERHFDGEHPNYSNE